MDSNNQLLLKCCRCKETKSSTEFHKSNTIKRGFGSYCKPCQSARTQKYYYDNWEKRQEVTKKYYETHPEALSQKKKKYYLKKGKEKQRERFKDSEYREKRNKWARTYTKRPEVKQRIRKKTKSPRHKIRNNLSQRIRRAIPKRSKINKTMDLVGCSLDFFRNYLESQFTPEMNWENYGNCWQIDHIIPCAAFDLTDPEQQKKCFHYTNMRPLKKEINLSKSDILPDGTRARDMKKGVFRGVEFLHLLNTSEPLISQNPLDINPDQPLPE